MKAFYILLFFILLSPNFARGQEFEDAEKVKSDILSFVDSLKRNEIDTIFTHQSNAIGYDRSVQVPIGSSEIVIDSLICETKEPGYIFWIFKGKSYCKKIHPCLEFETTVFQPSVFLEFFNNNPQILTFSPLKPFQYKERKGRVLTTVLDHSILTSLWLKIGSIEKGTIIDSYALSKRDTAIPAMNINYATNRENPVLLFSEILEKQIEQISFIKNEK